MEFTYEAYLKLIELIKENGYTITDYENYSRFNKAAILRHDVDLSIEKSLKMAKLEYDAEIQSTYFVLLTSPFYNLFSKESQDMIKEILSYGHNIGLHFDEVKYSEDNSCTKDSIKSFIFEEAYILERVTGEKVKFVSMHRPSEKTLKSNYDLYPMINSYGNTFFNEFKYVSDSRRVWREDVHEIVKSGVHKNIQVLTHAFWYNDKEVSLKEAFEDFVSSSKIKLYGNLSDNIKNLNEILSINEME